MRQYLVTLRHDGGIVRILVTATSKEAAIQIARVCERCPRRAIVSVT